jgi:hypothetical protein
MMVANGDSVCNVVSSGDAEDEEDEDDDESVQGQLSEDNLPGWVMGTTCKMVQQRMERIRKKQINLDEMTPLRLEDTANGICERDEMYGTSELRDPAVIQHQTDDDAGAPAPTALKELIDGLVIVPGIL